MTIDELDEYCRQSYKTGYSKAIDDLVEKAMEQFTDFDLKHRYPTVTDCKAILRYIAYQLKTGDLFPR